MQTQQSFSSPSTPGILWRCCPSWCWSKIRCTRTETSAPTPGRQGRGGAANCQTGTPAWASCRRTGSRRPPCGRFSSGQTAGWCGRRWRGRWRSKPRGLYRWSGPSPGCSRPARSVRPCQTGPRCSRWGAKCGPRKFWRWTPIWVRLRTLLPGPAHLSPLGRLCPPSGPSVLSRLKGNTDVNLHRNADLSLTHTHTHADVTWLPPVPLLSFVSHGSVSPIPAVSPRLPRTAVKAGRAGDTGLTSAQTGRDRVVFKLVGKMDVEDE